MLVNITTLAFILLHELSLEDHTKYFSYRIASKLDGWLYFVAMCYWTI